MKITFSLFIALVCFLLISCNKPTAKYDPQGYDTSTVNSLIRYSTGLLRKNPDSAIYFLNNTLTQSIALNYEKGIGESYEFLGVANFYKFRYDTAKAYHHKAYTIFEKAGNKNLMALVLYSLSYDYSLTHELHKALGYAEKARVLYEETGNYISLYDCIEGLAYLHKQLHNSETVDSLMKEMVHVAEKTGNNKKIANSYYNLGSYYIDQAYLNLAIEAFYKALNIAEESGDSVEIANAMGSVGLANLYLQEYRKAIDYYLSQELILKRQNNLYELSITYTNLGEAFNSLKEFETGLAYHLKALNLRQNMNFKLAISNSLHNVAYTYYLMNDSTDLALSYVRRSLAIDHEIENYPGFSRNYMLMGNLEIQKKDYPAGINHLEESLKLAKKYGETNVMLETSGMLSTLYADRNEFEKAFRNLIINTTLSDSIVSGRNVKKITQLEMQHAFDKKQNVLELNHLQETMQFETTLRRNRIMIVFSLVVVTLIGITGIVIYKSYLKSRKADKEKEALLREIHHRVKNNLMVISSLLNLQSGTITDDHTKSAVKESQSRVKSMALIHQLLYQSDKFARIDFHKYLEQLMASLQSTYCSPDFEISYYVKADDLNIDIDTAIPLGLITNELATNAYKYAFADSRKGSIQIDFFRTPDHMCRLRIADNGKGLPEGFDPDSSSTLGLKLVRILTKQIKAKLNYTSGAGTEFNIIFPEHV